jgi:purine-binding chemotaxis protein CheW
MKNKPTTPRPKPTPALDWSEIHRRIETAQAGLDQGVTRSVEEKNTILQARAKALAREPEEKAAGEEYLEVVEFVLAYETYGVQSSYVREVSPLKELTPLPGTPPFVLGVINVRGRILSVVDIKKFFDLPEKGLTDLNKVIILRSDSMEFGILADAILGVRNLSLGDLQPSLPTLTGIREEYLRGVTRERVVVLDAQKLLSDRNMIVHENVET